MKLKNATPFDIVKIVWDVLPQKDDKGGLAFAVVNTRDGKVFGVYEPDDKFVYDFSEENEIIFLLRFGNKVVRSKNELLSNWFIDKEIRSEKDALNLLHRRFKNEICCSLLELKEEYPNLA